MIVCVDEERYDVSIPRSRHTKLQRSDGRVRAFCPYANTSRRCNRMEESIAAAALEAATATTTTAVATSTAYTRRRRRRPAVVGTMTGQVCIQGGRG